jgi:uncharacterized protein with PIN domain
MICSKNYFLFVVIISLLCLSGIFAQENNNRVSAENQQSSEGNIDSSNVEKIYQCQIHPQILSNISGRCPRCELQLEHRTLQEAFANLGEKGAKKPELSLNYITRTVVEEEEVIADSAEVTDTTITLNTEILAEYDFELLDHDGDGMLWQCPNHPLEFEDDEGRCVECKTYYEKLTIDSVKDVLVRMNSPKEPEGEEDVAGTNENKP